MDERNLSDQEVALILRKATELQEQAGDRAPADGLSLATVRDIASEIGVDPRFIDQAVTVLATDAPAAASGLLGPPINSSIRFSYPQSLTEPQLREVIEAIRTSSGLQGKLDEALGAIEWRHEGMNTIGVTVTPVGDETSVALVSGLREAASLSYVPPTMLGIMAAGIAVDSLQPGVGTMLAMIAGGAVGGFGIGRTIWTLIHRSFDRKLQRIRAEIERVLARQRAETEAEDAVEIGEGSDQSDQGLG